MEDSPEVVKLLKYILFGYVFFSQALTTEANAKPGPDPVPQPHPLLLPDSSREDFFQHQHPPSGPVPPFQLQHPKNKGYNNPSSNDLDHPDRFKDHLAARTRMMMMASSEERERGGPQMSMSMPRILDKFGGSLCSIFRSFLDPSTGRRSRCSVSNRPERRRPGPGRGRMHMSMQDEMMMMMPMMQHHNQGMMVPLPLDQRDGQHQHPMSMSQAQAQAMMMEMMRKGNNGKRLDLDDQQINHSGEDEGENGNGEGQNPNLDHPSQSDLEGQEDLQEGNQIGNHNHIDPTKVQSRTMILVPERVCPPGHRRDARGYCRRLVKIRTNYQYGPPPIQPSRAQGQGQGQAGNGNVNGGNGNIRQIPIRYYYSRIVTIPAFQFFFPNVSV